MLFILTDCFVYAQLQDELLNPFQGIINVCQTP